jgi:hypothetical protein
MTAALALFLQYLPYLIQAGGSVPELISYVTKVREHYRQTGEWTKEQDDAFSKEIDDLINNPPPEWRPEA